MTGSLLDSIDLVVPAPGEQDDGDRARREGRDSPADSLYFNIEQVGNASSASIPLAIHDAVRDGVIKGPMRVFAPGFGAGAVAGYSVMRIDPAVVAMALTASAAAHVRGHRTGPRAVVGRRAAGVRVALAATSRADNVGHRRLRLASDQPSRGLWR